MNSKTKWLYLAVGTLMMLLVGLLHAWSIFRAPLSIMFPEWNATQMSTTFTVSILSFCILGFISGKLLQRVKVGTVLRIASVALAIGFTASSLSLNEKNAALSFTMLIVFYGIFCGGGVGLVYNSIIATITKWFPGKTGIVSGTLLMGFAFGSIILGNVVNELTSEIGFKLTFIIVGVSIAILICIGSFFVKSPHLLEPSLRSTSDGKNTENLPRSYTVSEMIKMPTAWLQFICMAALGTGGMIMLNSAAVVAMHFGTTAVVGLIFTVFGGIGRVCVGEYFDKFGRVKAVNVVSIGMMLAGFILFLGAQSGNLIFILIGLPILGLSFGGGPPINIGMTFKFFGPKYFPANCGFMTLILIPSATIGPLLSSRLQDASNGEFDSTFIMIIVMGAITLITGFIVTLLAKRDGLIEKKLS